jgi:hypothetical protein
MFFPHNSRVNAEKLITIPVSAGSFREIILSLPDPAQAAKEQDRKLNGFFHNMYGRLSIRQFLTRSLHRFRRIERQKGHYSVIPPRRLGRCRTNGNGDE